MFRADACVQTCLTPLLWLQILRLALVLLAMEAHKAVLRSRSVVPGKAS